MLTSHIQANLSCHRAFLGRMALAETYATTPMLETNASEYAEVAVNHSGVAIFFLSCAVVSVGGFRLARVTSCRG